MELNINRVNSVLEENLKRELIQQNHVASGRLLDSINVRTRKDGSNYVIEGRMLDYGLDVDKGLPKGTIVPVQNLIEWVRARNIAQGKRAVGEAFAVRKNIEREGVPTEGGKRMAIHRLHWISRALTLSIPKVKDLIRQADLEMKKEWEKETAAKIKQLQNV